MTLLLLAVLITANVFCQQEKPDPLLLISEPLFAHHPFKIRCTAKPTGRGKVMLTFQFEQDSRYQINLKPEPKLDILRADSSILPRKLVPADLRRDPDSHYYGKLAPLTVVVDRMSGLQAQFTYVFCSKKDGFCARKTDKIDLQVP
jgi:hypothetical protein